MKKLLGAARTVSFSLQAYERRREFMRGSLVRVEGKLNSNLSFGSSSLSKFSQHPLLD